MTETEVIPKNACARYEHCRNLVPGSGQMCGNCLDEVREAQQNGEELNINI